MRPGAVVVAVISLFLAFATVVWLGQSVSGVSVTPSSPPKPKDRDDFPTPSTVGPHPKVDFVETEYDFGTMRRFASGAHEFVVKNDGEATLRLMAGDTTCQCTVGELGRSEVAPGESTTIELSWTIKQAGPDFQHSAQIHTNDPQNPVQTLVVKGFIGVDLAMYPNERWSLGSLRSDGITEFDGYVFSHISDDFEITKLDHESDGIEVQSFPMSDDEIAALGAKLTSESAGPPDPHGNNPEPKYPDIRFGHRIHVTANSQIPVGQFVLPLTIHTTVKEVPTIPVAISGVRPGPFQFFPLPGTQYRHGAMLVDAGEFSSTEEHTAGLLVITRGFDGELKIEDFTAEPQWLKVSLKSDPGEGAVQRYRLNLTFPAGLPPMVRSITNPATIQIRTNHPHASTLNLKAAFVVEE